MQRRMFNIQIILAISLFIKNSISYPPWNFNGTTPNIQYIFEGRCYQYQELNKNNKLVPLANSINCNQLWNSFSTVFAYKESCQTKYTETDYDGYFSMIRYTGKLENKALFWSGTRRVVHDFSFVNDNYLTLEDTFSGYVADSLTWCGCKSCKTGINYDDCTQGPKCGDPINAHWEHASREFAKSAEGKVYLMLKSTPKEGETAYYRGSYFGRVELPTLGKYKNVKDIEIYLVADVDKEPIEKCGENSLLQLDEDASKYGITTTCIQNERMVQSLLCAKYPNSKECKEYEKRVSQSWKQGCIALIVIVIILVLIIIGFCVCRSKTKCGCGSCEFEPEINICCCSKENN